MLSWTSCWHSMLARSYERRSGVAHTPKAVCYDGGIPFFSLNRFWMTGRLNQYSRNSILVLPYVFFSLYT